MGINEFRPIDLSDKDQFNRFLSEDPPAISELTFTNLFMWRDCYNTLWQIRKNCLLLVMRPNREPAFALPPVGPGDKVEAIEFLIGFLRQAPSEPRICRASEDFIEKFVDKKSFAAMEDRNNSDYVYLALDLVELPGNKFHKKKNHLNKFIKNYQFEYLKLDAALIERILEMQEQWCELKDCPTNPDLLAEDRAVYEALINYESLDFTGGAILIDSKVEAFTLGERLNSDTAVIHIEKANPEIPGLYAAINRFFCEDALSNFTYINREQDLGLEGLRKAKESYHPHHMVNKFILAPREFAP
jgi:uncharacterized protein